MECFKLQQIGRVPTSATCLAISLKYYGTVPKLSLLVKKLHATVFLVWYQYLVVPLLRINPYGTVGRYQVQTYLRSYLLYYHCYESA